MLHKIKPQSYLRELLIVVIFLFNSICFVVKKLIPTVSDFGDVLIILVILLGTINCLISRKIILRKFLLINFMILIFAMGSFVFYNFNSEIGRLLVNYLVWGVIITFFMTLDYDLQKLLNIALPISSFILLVDLLLDSVELFDSMSWTYSVFPCMCICFTHLFFLKGQFGRIRWLFYLPAVFTLFRFFMDANRGGWVSLIILVYLLTIKVRIKHDTKMRNRVLWNVFFLILITIAVFLYEPIIKLLYQVTAALDMRVFAVEKMYRGILVDNVTNDRMELYQFAWRGFLSSPIWGHGIGAFSVTHGGWPHNFILQLLYEGGIVLFLMVLVPLIKIVRAVICSKLITNAEYALFVCLFANSIPKLLFSAQVWNVQGFWLLLAFGMVILPRIQHSEKVETL